MKKCFFTLIELLTVIAIIIILAGILLPAISGSLKKADVTKARAQMTTLANAIKQYQAQYGKMPIPKNHDENEALDEDEYKWLIEILQNQTPTKPDDYGTLAKHNPRGIKFLDIVGNSPGEYKDPWDNDYHVFMDTNHDDAISKTQNKTSKDAVTSFIPGLIPKAKKNAGDKYDPIYYYSVLIYSRGPDGDDNNTVSNSTNKDNVYSLSTKWVKDEGHNIEK